MTTKSALCIGSLLNLLLLSAPLIVVDGDVYQVLSRPVTVTFYLLITFFCVSESFMSRTIGSIKVIKADKTFLPYLTGLSIMSIFWFSLYEYAHGLYSFSPQSLIGTVVLCTGITIRIISIRSLNTFFISHIALTRNHQLITTGIYSIVRHPSELGLLMICLGSSLLLSSLTGLALTALIQVPLTLYRIALEDKLLQSQFDMEFNNYKKLTPALIPCSKLFLYNQLPKAETNSGREAL